MAWGLAGCHKTPPATSDTTVDQNGVDPADANMAPVSGDGSAPAQVLGQNAQYQPQQQGEDYSQQQAAPIERVAPGAGDQSYSDSEQSDPYASDLTDEQATQPPPPLPEYDQPPAPDPDYLWTPGYWAWGPEGYYWVPGAWAAPPYVGALWTPGYWGFVGGYYRFHHGFWGLHIGFYGGIDYGYGYVGHGYYGGYWNGGHFFYNTAITHVNVNVIHNVYVHNVVINNVTVNNRVINRVSFNGGSGGVQARPVAAEVAVLHEQRNAPMASQVQAQHEAAQNKQQFYSANQGRPAVAVAARPIAADRTPPAALPRIAQPAARGEVRPAQVPAQAARPQTGAPVRSAPEAARQAQAPEPRPVPVPQNRPEQARPNEPQARPGQPQPQARPAQPQPQARPAQPQPQARPAQPQPRPEAQPRPQPAPKPQAAAPHPQPAPHPQSAPKPPPPQHEEEKPRG
jgi:hypothetical protein